MTTVYKGYLEVEPYLSTYPYLTTNQGDTSEGMQFKAIILEDVPKGIQFVAPQLRSGVQFDATIRQDDQRGLEFISSPFLHVPCGDGFYLEYSPYLTNHPYLVGQNCVFAGTQFFAQVFATDQRALQFRGVNPEDDTDAVQFDATITNQTPYGNQFAAPQLWTGVQFQGVITKANQYGMQFFQSPFLHVPCGDGFYLEYSPYLTAHPYLISQYCVFAGNQVFATILEQQAFGAQFQGVIQKATTYGAQFKGIITEEYLRGIQFSVINSTFYGAQFRVILYNTTQLRILCEFPSRGDGTSWTVANGGTATSSSNAFDVNNLNTDIVEQVYRSTTASNVQLVCDTNVPQGVFVDTLGILNHNFTRGATVTFEGSNSPVFATSQSFSVPVTSVNAYWIAPEAPLTAYRYWRINVQDPANPDGYIQIGTVVFGAAEIFSLAESNFVDQVTFGQRHFVDKVFTEGQTNVSNDRGKKRYIGLDFRSISYERNGYNILSNLFTTYGVSHKCLWIPTPTVPERFAVFGKLQEIPQETHNYKGDTADYVSLSVQVDESL